MSLLSIVTSLALLLHAVLGCCWHHDHHSTSSYRPVADSWRGEHHHAACNGRHRVATQDDPADREAPTHEHPSCEEARCLFVSTGFAVVLHDCDALAFDESASLALTNSARAGISPADVLLHDSFTKSAGDHCAQLQVWLA